MNVNLSAEDLYIEAEINSNGETIEIEKADMTIETDYDKREVVVTLTDPNDSNESVSFKIAGTRVEVLCDALLAVAKKSLMGANTYIE